LFLTWFNLQWVKTHGLFQKVEAFIFYLIGMKNNIAVFILIILVTSSFKYRSKTSGNLVPSQARQEGIELLPDIEEESRGAFEDVLTKMQQANVALANGNTEEIKKLWSRDDEVTIFCGAHGAQVKGWDAVETRLDWLCNQITPGSKYTFERISTQAGESFGSLQQTEHYISMDGTQVNLGVTILFKREADGWKIVHRHAENLSPRIASM
jgi:ketosteroid isomerase-like protein